MIPKKRSGRIWLSDFYLIVGSIKSKNPKTRVIVGTFYVHILIIDFNVLTNSFVKTHGIRDRFYRMGQAHWGIQCYEW